MEFRILGPLSVRTEGRDLPLGSAQQRTVLAVLLLHAGEPVPAARLVDDLWGERPPATATKAVQVRISELRKALGEGVIETHALGYVIRPDDDALDAARFERLLEQGRRLLAGGEAVRAAELLDEALALWRGPALADFVYEEFARGDAARLEELRLVALESQLEAALALGRHAETVPELERLVREHPLRERLRELLMLALYRAGRQADALAVYQDARAALRDELGLDPGHSLQRLEKAILQQDQSLDSVAAAAPVPAAAPARPAPRPLVCAACGTANAPGAAFCRACGETLGAKPVPETRKTVTVLFCDVVAYTELAGRLDPEALRHLMSRFFELAAGAIEAHGGTVEKFVGDEVMAVFGVPAVREDDALRAVRAALEVRELVPVLETERGARLEVRIGVNTGEVVAGDSAAGHAFVTGEAVAVGKRLQQSADAGEVLLGAATHALVAHAVQAVPLEPVGVKGKHEAVAAFRLDAVVEGATAVPRRDDSPLVGRERELEWLRGVFAEVAGGAGARQVTLVGEPGIGKSRLGREFVAGLGEEATVLVGRCPPYGEGITFWPLRELLRQAGRDETSLVGSSHEVFAAVRRILEELARERPLVAVFDDVHWAEPTFLDFVEYLAGRLGDARVLAFCLARPQLAEQRPAWLQPPTAALVLEPLSATDSERLLENLGAPAAVRPRIAEAAEGNPLFVEQLAAIAGDETVAGEMPGSIRGVLHERLDRLEGEERSLLERAAVAGRSFSLAAVLELTPEAERDTVQARLLALERKRLVRPDPAAPQEGFRFHHALIRDAAYDGVPKATRAELHERVAARLEAGSADDALVGYHLEQACLFRRELGIPADELGLQAGRLLAAAARDAFARTDLPATVTLFERARTLLAPEDAARLLPELGEALFEAGRLAEADEILSEAIGQAEGVPILRARASVEQQFVRMHADPGVDVAEARRVATEALQAFENEKDELGQCRASGLLAWVEWTECHATAADAAWQRAAAHAEAIGGERELFKILGWRASAAVEGPTPVTDAIERCLTIRERVASRPVAVAVTLKPLAALHAMLGDFVLAHASLDEANAILDDLGRMQSAASHHEALVHTLAGDPAAAEQLLQRGYDRLDAIGEKAIRSTTAAMLAAAIYAQERYREAERYCKISERTAAKDDLLTQVIWRCVYAKILARRGRTDEAERLVRDAVQLVGRTDQLTHHADALIDLAKVLRRAGRTAEADRAVRDAIDLYERKGNVVSAAYARSLAGTVASNQPPA
jgi:class 3 adenylate cyclase/DNA-binding SARP family transcriptional activator